MTTTRPRSTIHRLRVLVLSLLLAACAGAPPAQAPTPTAAVSPDPGATVGDPGSTAPPEVGALPAPTLGSVDEVIAAIDDPAKAEQVVVSMLALLGLGLYAPDGAAIRPGTETSDRDYYVFEPAARGLAAMLRERDEPDSQMSFRDMHAALASGGYDGSAEELATAYASAYAAQPEAAISRLIAALGPVEVEATLSDFEVWLLVLDGFIPPNGAASAMANASGGIPAVAAGGGGWGVARSSIQAARTLPPSAWVAMANQLRAVLYAWRITLSVAPAAVHEGHGALGEPATITARVTGPMEALISPFSGATILPAPTGTEGLPIGWRGTSTLTKHGWIADSATVVDISGEAKTTFVPKQEDAGGNGIDREDLGGIHAGFMRRDLVLRLYGEFAAPYTRFFAGLWTTNALLYVNWHEAAEAVIKIVWTDTYNGVADTIIFLGNLTTTDGDPLAGGMYTGTGTASGSRAAWAACNPGIDVVPSGTVDATFNGILTGDGSIAISAYADPFTALAGISTAPMEVPIIGGFQQWDSATVGGGDLCPHTSHGEMTVTMLALP